MTETALAPPPATAPVAAGSLGPVRSPWQIFWREFQKSPAALAGGVLLIGFYLTAALAPVIAPYPLDFQVREFSWAPPTKIHFLDTQGRFRAPFVYGTTSESVAEKRYGEDRTAIYPLRLFPVGEPYRFLGIRSDRHLFGVEAPGRLFLFGADLYGRDIFSRIVHGSRISLSVGLLGIMISFSLGLLLGGIAGYFGGLSDTLLMRLTEILMSVPGLYMILALRSVFPDDMPSDRMYMIIVGILALISWASLSRVIRGMVLAIRQNEYVTAARALGMGGFRIILRHILPNTMSFTIVAATISVPAYILGEVALSFLGVGIQEPQASWGLMLSQAQNVSVLSSFPWVLTPGYFIFITVLAYNFLGDGLRDALDPRKVR
jgi:peptide/nickel transport system permease protein